MPLCEHPTCQVGYIGTGPMANTSGVCLGRGRASRPASRCGSQPSGSSGSAGYVSRPSRTQAKSVRACGSTVRGPLMSRTAPPQTLSASAIRRRWHRQGTASEQRIAVRARSALALSSSSAAANGGVALESAQAWNASTRQAVWSDRVARRPVGRRGRRSAESRSQRAPAWRPGPRD